MIGVRQLGPGGLGWRDLGGASRRARGDRWGSVLRRRGRGRDRDRLRRWNPGRDRHQFAWLRRRDWGQVGIGREEGLNDGACDGLRRPRHRDLDALILAGLRLPPLEFGRGGRLWFGPMDRGHGGRDGKIGRLRNRPAWRGGPGAGWLDEPAAGQPGHFRGEAGNPVAEG